MMENLIPISKPANPCKGVKQTSPLYNIPFDIIGEFMQICGTLEIIPNEPAQGTLVFGLHV